MAQRADRKILRELQNNGVRSIKAYNEVSRQLTIIHTDKGMFKYFRDELYYLVAPRQGLWKNCRTGFLLEDFENQNYFK